MTKTYSVGTLTYTKAAIFTLSLWLLWGDFCFTLMESLIPNILPLVLNKEQAPNWVIGLFMITIPGILNAIINPIISTWSDRYRSPQGRRIPFLKYATIPITMCLIAIGFSHEISDLSHELTKDPKWASILTLGYIGIMVTGFQVFNMVVSSVYYYLFNDVVPKEFLSRFMALFRTVGILAGSFFNFFILKFTETHTKEIFSGCALLYSIAFLFMCHRVKEGEYPPPPVFSDKIRKNYIKTAISIIKESFCHPIYFWFYLANASLTCSGIVNIYQILFAKSLGITLAQFGAFMGAASLVSATLLIPGGILADRIHPLKTMLIAIFGSLLVIPAQLVFLFHEPGPDNAYSWWIISFGLFIPLQALYMASELPTYMRILPEEKYGQFCSINAMVRSLAAIVMGLVLGGGLDLLKDMHHGTDFYYRYCPIWTFLFQLLGLFCLLKVYRQWKELGGIKNYVSPI